MQYIGDLRAYIASAFACQPGEVRLISLGQEHADDSVQLLDLLATVVDTLCFHAMRVKLNVAYVSSQPPDVRDIVAATCPDVLMGGDAALLRLLIYLLDFPAAQHAAHAQAFEVLSRLGTAADVARELRAACAPAAAAAGEFPPGVRRALNIPAPGAPAAQRRPGALLYTLEALQELMEPATRLAPGAAPVLHSLWCTDTRLRAPPQCRPSCKPSRAVQAARRCSWATSIARCSR